MGCERECVLYSLNTTVFACIHLWLCVFGLNTYSFLRSEYLPRIGPACSLPTRNNNLSVIA